MKTAAKTYETDVQLDLASALLTQALLAPFFTRRDRGALGAEAHTAPTKPAPSAARELVLA